MSLKVQQVCDGWDATGLTSAGERVTLHFRKEPTAKDADAALKTYEQAQAAAKEQAAAQALEEEKAKALDAAATAALYARAAKYDALSEALHKLSAETKADIAKETPELSAELAVAPAEEEPIDIGAKG